MKPQHFDTVEEGLKLFLDGFAAKSLAPSMSLCDDMVKNFNDFFAVEQDKFIAMLTVQALRSIAWENNDDVTEIQCETNFIPDEDDETLLINEFQEYEFSICPGKYIPDGTRVGYEKDLPDGKVEFFVDSGIVYSDRSKCATILS